MAFRTEWDTDVNPIYDIWTSVNGSEVVPGVVRPLVASFFNRLDHDTLNELMGSYPAGSAVELFAPPVANFMGIFAGRMALNNGFSAAAISALDPEIAQAVLQQFFTGASGGERFVVDVPDELRAESYAVATAQREAAPAKLAADHARLMEERRSDRASVDLALDLPAAWSRLLALCRENAVDLLGHHLMVSTAAGEFQVRLGGVLAAGGLDPNAVVPLCSGLGDVESSKPALALYELSALVRRYPSVRAALDAGDATVVAGLAARPDAEWQAFGQAYDRFQCEWGYRVQGEVDFTNPDWSERPEFVVSQLRSMIALDDERAPGRGVDRAMADREALEDALRERLPSDLRSSFDDTLEKAQRFTRLRELSKAVWVLGCRRSRAPYRAVCRGMVDLGAIDHPDDTAYLLADEIEAVVEGGSGAGCREVVARRRRQAAEAERYRLPDNWFGDPVATLVTVGERPAALSGLGVSGGQGPVTGPARVIHSVEAGMVCDIEPGEILVAPFTDAPWTSLFVVAAGVVVETGGVLSHAATVARELDIPAVVMVKEATAWIADGDLVTVDGAAGTVAVTRRTDA